MKKQQLTRTAVVFGGVLAIAPAMAFAQKADHPTGTPASRYSDRERSPDWNKEKDMLEKSLKLGETKGFYQKELEKKGWTITAVNYDKPDYVEWEIVKGDHSFEVQIDLDKSNRASKIDVAANMWRADATKKMMKGNKVTAMGRGDVRFSDRDHRADWTKGKEQLEHALKTGQDKAEYRRELEKMGWQITSVNSDKPTYTEWEIVKEDQSYEVQIDFDKATHKATKIDVATNMWQTDATERALESHRSAKR